MNLTKREKATLVLVKRACYNSKVNNDERFWSECRQSLKVHHREHYVQTKAYHRQKNNTTNIVNSPDHTDSDVSDDSEPESDSSTRLAFTRSVPNDSTNNNRNVSEIQKRINDGEAADKEFKKVASNWIEFKPKYKKR